MSLMLPFLYFLTDRHERVVSLLTISSINLLDIDSNTMVRKIFNERNDYLCFSLVFSDEVLHQVQLRNL